MLLFFIGIRLFIILYSALAGKFYLSRVAISYRLIAVISLVVVLFSHLIFQDILLDFIICFPGPGYVV